MSSFKGLESNFSPEFSKGEGEDLVNYHVLWVSDLGGRTLKRKREGDVKKICTDGSLWLIIGFQKITQALNLD